MVRFRSLLLSSFVAALVSIALAAVALAGDGQVPLPR